MTEVRVHLEGEHAHLGEVAAADVAWLILAVEHAAARAASVLVGRPKTTTGRYDDVVERSVHFRLVGIEEGSVIPVLELPVLTPSDGSFDLGTESLGEAALHLLLDAVDPGSQPHPIVAKALLAMADQLQVGVRYASVIFTTNGTARAGRSARVDRDVRSRLREYVDRVETPRVRMDTVSGVLVEADFEKRTARLRAPGEPAVQVMFTDDLDDLIQEGLRRPSVLRGEVTFNSKTHIAKSVLLKAIGWGEQLTLDVDPADFWRERTIVDLAREQGLDGPTDLEALFAADATDDERDAFFSALAELG